MNFNNPYKPSSPEGIRTELNPLEELMFQVWYKDIAKKQKIDPDPDNPLHFYDYRGAWKEGFEPDKAGHWPSKFKDMSHPNRYVGGMDTIFGTNL